MKTLLITLILFSSTTVLAFNQLSQNERHETENEIREIKIRDEKINQKIEEAMHEVQKLSHTHNGKAKKQASKKLDQLRAARELDIQIMEELSDKLTCFQELCKGPRLEEIDEDLRGLKSAARKSPVIQKFYESERAPGESTR